MTAPVVPTPQSVDGSKTSHRSAHLTTGGVAGRNSAVPARAALPCPPHAARRRLDLLLVTQQSLIAARQRTEQRATKLNDYLAIADGVSATLDKLSEDMFGRIVHVLEENLTRALQEVLEQPMRLKVGRDYKRGTATISFHIESQGQPEDIMRGQGGSVANILSVGLRMFALATLPEERHRRFLVLDEQDCWLRPDLVPRLVKIVHDAGRALGFQVLMISHHEIATFERYADKIYQFIPDPRGLRVQTWPQEAGQADSVDGAGLADSEKSLDSKLPLFRRRE